MTRQHFANRCDSHFATRTVLLASILIRPDKCLLTAAPLVPIFLSRLRHLTSRTRYTFKVNKDLHPCSVFYTLNYITVFNWLISFLELPTQTRYKNRADVVLG